MVSAARTIKTFARSVATLAAKVAGMSISADGGPSILGMGGVTQAGALITEDTAMTISAVYAAVEIRSSIKACLPLGAYRKIGSVRTCADTHPATRVLSIEPNSDMTPMHFWQTLEMHKLLWGVAYAEIEWDGGGNVRALWPIEPWRVRPERIDGQLWFCVDGVRKIHDRDILRSPHMSYDGVCGRSVITWARESLGLTVAAQDYGATFFGNGGVPSGVLEHPGSPKPEVRKQMRKEWHEVHSPSSGGKNNNVAVLWEGMKYNRISLPPGDAQFLDTRKFQITEIARWFNVPPHMLRDLDRATFSNIEHQQIEFVLYSLLPGLVAWEQEIDRKLLNPPKLYAKHCVRGLLRGDLKAQAEFFARMFQIGVYSVNEIKDLLDENGIGEDGDCHFVPANMVEISKACADDPPGTPPDAPEAGNMPDGEDPADHPTDGPTDSESEDPNTQNDMAAQISAEFLGDTISRLLRKEAKDAERAAGDPGKFLNWLNSFYDHHAEVCSEALSKPVASALTALQIGNEPQIALSSLVSRHIEESRRQLLAACECQPGELREKVSACVGTWESRAKINPESLRKELAS